MRVRESHVQGLQREVIDHHSRGGDVSRAVRVRHARRDRARVSSEGTRGRHPSSPRHARVFATARVLTLRRGDVALAFRLLARVAVSPPSPSDAVRADVAFVEFERPLLRGSRGTVRVPAVASRGRAGVPSAFPSASPARPVASYSRRLASSERTRYASEISKNFAAAASGSAGFLSGWYRSARRRYARFSRARQSSASASARDTPSNSYRSLGAEASRAEAIARRSSGERARAAADGFAGSESDADANGEDACKAAEEEEELEEGERVSFPSSFSSSSVPSSSSSSSPVSSSSFAGSTGVRVVQGASRGCGVRVRGVHHPAQQPRPSPVDPRARQRHRGVPSVHRGVFRRRRFQSGQRRRARSNRRLRRRRRRRVGFAHHPDPDPDTSDRPRRARLHATQTRVRLEAEEFLDVRVSERA